jgi:hypothetical protein
MALAGLFVGLMAIVPLFLPPQMNSRNTLANPLFEDIHPSVYPIKRLLSLSRKKLHAPYLFSKHRRLQKVAHPQKLFRTACSVQ